MSHFHIHGKNIFEVPIIAGKLEKFAMCTINLKAFYMELHDLLVKAGFKDMLGTPNQIKNGNFLGGHVKAGEWVDQKANENRTSDMFEFHFFWGKSPEGTVEFELKWKAYLKSPYSQHGWYEFHMDMVCRRIMEVETLVGNQKTTAQKGTWEFRNKLLYKNAINPNYLSNIPFIGNSDKLKQILVDTIFKKQLEEDFHFCLHDVKDKIYSVFNKHLSSIQTGH